MTSSAAFMSVNFLPTFIEAYKSHQCLWKVKAKEYSNKPLREAAYNDLVELTKTVIPNCNVDFIKKKIDILRGCFRREYRKVRCSNKSGSRAKSVYEPKLWYYKYLVFLADRQARPYCSSGDNEEDDKDVRKREYDEDEETPTVECADSLTTSAASNSATPRYRLRRGKGDDNNTFYLQNAISNLDRKDEFDAFGCNIAAQLRNMDYMQNIYCQHVINQVLFQGKLKKMQEDSAVVHPAVNIPPRSDGHLW